MLTCMPRSTAAFLVGRVHSLSQVDYLIEPSEGRLTQISLNFQNLYELKAQKPNFFSSSRESLEANITQTRREQEASKVSSAR